MEMAEGPIEIRIDASGTGEAVSTVRQMWLSTAEIGLGPWEAEDADDPEILQAIVDDIHMVIGVGHQEDVSWITADVIRNYIRTKGRTCGWFALCGNPAVAMVPHPALGEVPICGRCAAKVEKLRSSG